MRVCFVSRGTVSQFSEKFGGTDAEILFFGFSSNGEVSYERELKGETSCFEDIAILSKTCQNTVVCPCITSTRGLKRKSAVVAEKGKILGVSDMTCAIDGKLNPGTGFRVYDTKCGRMGLLVGEDLYFPENVRTLALCGADFVLCPVERMQEGVESVLLRAAAFSYGIPFLLNADGYSLIAGVKGEVVCASPVSPVEFSVDEEKEYHLVEIRRRGFSTRTRRGF